MTCWSNIKLTLTLFHVQLFCQLHTLGTLFIAKEGGMVYNYPHSEPFIKLTNTIVTMSGCHFTLSRQFFFFWQQFFTIFSFFGLEFFSCSRSFFFAEQTIFRCSTDEYSLCNGWYLFLAQQVIIFAHYSLYNWWIFIKLTIFFFLAVYDLWFFPVKFYLCRFCFSIFVNIGDTHIHETNLMFLRKTKQNLQTNRTAV